MHVETRIHEYRQTRELVILIQDIVVFWVYLPAQDLWSCCSINMNDSWRFLLTSRGDVIGDGHKFSGMRSLVVIVLKEYRRVLLANDRSKWHEFSPTQLFVKPLID